MMADGVHKLGTALTELLELYGRDALRFPDIIELLCQCLCLMCITSIMEQVLSVLQPGYLICA